VEFVFDKQLFYKSLTAKRDL